MELTYAVGMGDRRPFLRKHQPPDRKNGFRIEKNESVTLKITTRAERILANRQRQEETVFSTLDSPVQKSPLKGLPIFPLSKPEVKDHYNDLDDFAAAACRPGS